MNGWLFVVVTFAAIWMMWRFFHFVADILEIYFDHYRAARHKREAVPPNKERERSS